MFVLDPTIGSFLLVDDDVRIPESGKSYSLNAANVPRAAAGYQRYVEWANGEGYTMRYAGAMVADVYRTLMKGGVFLYPPTAKDPSGKLRLMYEANPGDDRRAGGRQALLACTHAHHGGGAHGDPPARLNQRLRGVFSASEVDTVLRYIAADAAPPARDARKGPVGSAPTAA